MSEEKIFELKLKIFMPCLFSLLDSAEMTSPRGYAYTDGDPGCSGRVSLGFTRRAWRRMPEHGGLESTFVLWNGNYC